VTSVCVNTCQPAARIASVFFGDGIERDALGLDERRPPPAARNFSSGTLPSLAARMGRKRQCDPPSSALRGNCRDRK
jgi:hypothetical protein